MSKSINSYDNFWKWLKSLNVMDDEKLKLSKKCIDLHIETQIAEAYKVGAEAMYEVIRLRQPLPKDIDNYSGENAGYYYARDDIRKTQAQHAQQFLDSLSKDGERTTTI